MPAKNECAICGRPVTQAFKPFCSQRCADLDLGRWLKGAYAIPAVEEDEDGADEPPEEAPSGQGGKRVH